MAVMFHPIYLTPVHNVFTHMCYTNGYDILYTYHRNDIVQQWILQVPLEMSEAATVV